MAAEAVLRTTEMATLVQVRDVEAMAAPRIEMALVVTRAARHRVPKEMARIRTIRRIRATEILTNPKPMNN